MLHEENQSIVQGETFSDDTYTYTGTQFDLFKNWRFNVIRRASRCITRFDYRTPNKIYPRFTFRKLSNTDLLIDQIKIFSVIIFDEKDIRSFGSDTLLQERKDRSHTRNHIYVFLAQLQTEQNDKSYMLFVSKSKRALLTNLMQNV